VVRAQGARAVVLAVPVAARDALARLRAEADAVVTPGVLACGGAVLAGCAPGRRRLRRSRPIGVLSPWVRDRGRRWLKVAGEVEEKGAEVAIVVPRATLFPDLFRVLESGWPTAAFSDRHLARIEHFRDNGNYVLRAELPGMDPDKDIHVSVEGGELVLTAERTEEKHDETHSEFSYGSFARTVRLPAGADTGNIKAGYHAGILEVMVPIKDEVTGRQIPVTG
jgi:HSP20 family molecular chaperone IbpA